MKIVKKKVKKNKLINILCKFNTLCMYYVLYD